MGIQTYFSVTVTDNDINVMKRPTKSSKTLVTTKTYKLSVASKISRDKKNFKVIVSRVYLSILGNLEGTYVLLQNTKDLATFCYRVHSYRLTFTWKY